MTQRYAKYHALGNDYLVLDPIRFSVPLTTARIQKICHRNFGLGSDGILYGPIDAHGIPLVQIYNPDGSEAEKSGNGIRIFAKYLWDNGLATSDYLDVVTKGGKVSVLRNNSQATNLTVSMGQFSRLWEEHMEIGGITKRWVNAVSIGNPHAVVMLVDSDEISEEKARQLGPIIENHPDFPDRTNVQLVKVLDRRNIQIEIWERGAGYTLASGSSSCAAAGVCYTKRLCDEDITVHMPGGNLEIRVEDGLQMIMTGEVESVAEGQFTSSFIDQLLKLE